MFATRRTMVLYLVLLTLSFSACRGGGPSNLSNTGTFVFAWTTTGGDVTTMESSDGLTWSNPQVHQTVIAGSNTSGPSVTSDGGRTYFLVWKNGPELQYKIGLGRLDPVSGSGITWESAPTIGQLPVLPEGSPAAAGDGNNWLVVYRNAADQVQSVRGQAGAGGITWDNPTQVMVGTPTRPVVSNRNPAVAYGALGAGPRYVLLFYGSNQTIQATLSTDGLSWSNPAPVGITGKDPAIFYRAGAFYAVSHRTVGQGGLFQEKFYIHRSTDGSTWPTIDSIPRTAFNSTGPGMAFGKNSMLVTEMLGGALGGGAARITTRRGRATHPASTPTAISFDEDRDVLEPGGNRVTTHPSARTSLTFGQITTGLGNVDYGFTQNGIFGPALPAPDAVAGKTFMVHANLSRAIDSVQLDVVDLANGTTVTTIPGFTFAADNQTPDFTFQAGEDIHFFVPGSLLGRGMSTRFDLRYYWPDTTVTAPAALEAVTFASTFGVTLATVTFDQAPPSLTTIRGDLREMTRLYPLADSVGALGTRNPAQPPGGFDPGVRFQAGGNFSLPVQGSLGNPLQEFVLINLVIATTGPCAPAASLPTVTQPGRSFAFNFTFPEELDGQPGFQGVDVQICQGSPRTSTMTSRMKNNARSAAGQIAGQQPQDPPKFAAAVVTAGPPLSNAQNRTGLWGQCSQDLTSDRLCWANVGFGRVIIAHELGHSFGLCHSDDTACGNAIAAGTGPPFGYDLLRQRRTPNPQSMMVGAAPLDTLAFLWPADFEFIKRQLASPAYLGLGAP